MTKTSIGVQELRKRIGHKAKTESQHRFWGLYTHVYKLDVLREAYRLAKQNHGAPGVDGVTFWQIEAQGEEEFLKTLSQELREQTYRPLPCRQVNIPKEGGKVRGLKIPAIRDRVVQGAVRLVTEPIFEADFQPGSFGYRPERTAHQALERVRQGLNKHLHQIIDLDLKSYFDSVPHQRLLEKLAKRIDDDKLMWLCKQILKSGGKRGLPQGSVIGALWANVYLNEVERMLERAQEVTREGAFDAVRYTRYADDLIVQASNQPWRRHWAAKVEKRLREELEKLELSVNEDKSRVVNFAVGQPFDFLGYTFRRVENRRAGTGKTMALCRPQRKRRTQFLREVRDVLTKVRHVPVEEVVRKIINPRVRGWVNYFRWGNSGRDLSFVRWQVHGKVCRFASRQRPKNRKGHRGWTTWSDEEVYGQWKLRRDYKVSPRSESMPPRQPTAMWENSVGNAGWRKSPCPV